VIVHLVHDEKFIDMAFRIFEEVAPNQNECIALSPSPELTFIKTTPCRIVDPLTANLKEVASQLEQYDVIVVHMLDFYKQQVLQYVSKKTRIVWIGFGVDYYDLIVKSNTDRIFHQFWRV